MSPAAGVVADRTVPGPAGTDGAASGRTPPARGTPAGRTLAGGTPGREPVAGGTVAAPRAAEGRAAAGGPTPGGARSGATTTGRPEAAGRAGTARARAGAEEAGGRRARAFGTGGPGTPAAAATGAEGARAAAATGAIGAPVAGAGGPEGDQVVFAAVAATAEVLARPDLATDLLAPWELHRLTRIRVPRRRDDVLAARLLLRLCVARLTGQPPGATELAQHCAGCGRSGHGRPGLPGLPAVGVSLSHADGLVAAAAGPGAVGIDVEPRTRRPGPLPVLRRLFPDTDPYDGAALLRAWVRREALFKAGWNDAEDHDGPRGALHLLEWTDLDRGAVAALAGTGPAIARAVSPL